jgi:hypothetical protein
MILRIVSASGSEPAFQISGYSLITTALSYRKVMDIAVVLDARVNKE